MLSLSLSLSLTLSLSLSLHPLFLTQILSEKLKSLSSEQHDDELVREHLLSLLKVWVFRCFDHVKSIDQEVDLLEAMAKMKRGGARQPAAAPPPARPPMKPIVITRESLKVCVYFYYLCLHVHVHADIYFFLFFFLIETCTCTVQLHMYM